MAVTPAIVLDKPLGTPGSLRWSSRSGTTVARQEDGSDSGHEKTAGLAPLAHNGTVWTVASSSRYVHTANGDSSG